MTDSVMEKVRELWALWGGNPRFLEKLEKLETPRSETVTNERRILTKDCRIGATIIRAGCHWDTVIGRAEREYEYHAKNAAPDAEAASGREVPAAAPVAAPDRCKHGVWAADHCWECDPHPNTSRSASAEKNPLPELLQGIWTPARCLHLGHAEQIDQLCALLNELQEVK